jgi:hypothetical protein
MNEQFITCPKCDERIKLTDAIRSPIEEGLRREFEAQSKQREKEFDERLAEARAQLEEKAKKQAEESVTVELKDLRAQLDERSQQLDTARKQELDLRKRQRELEAREKNQELELARKLDEERQKIWREAASKSDEQNLMRMREKDLLMEQLKGQIEELKKRVEQGPQQRQGEAQELVLDDRLRAQFPFDEIEAVAKGRKGGDVIQRVRDNVGRQAGSILWESKRTRAWSDTWIAKLKDDMRAAKADVAVLVTEVLPKDCEHSGLVEGVWVADFPFALGLGMALRDALLQITQARGAASGQAEKMEVLYRYLSGPQFRQRVEAIVESFSTMKVDLDAEKRAMERQWAKREKQIERVISNTSGMYGDLQGIIGAALPAVKMLELSPGDTSSQESPKGGC